MHGWHKAALGLLLGMSMMPSVSAAPEYDRKTKSATSSSVVTDTVLWTPASGFRVYIESCAVSSGGAQQTLLEIAGTTAILPRIYTAADTTEQFYVDTTGATDETVTYTTSSSTTTTIVCNGYEFQG